MADCPIPDGAEYWERPYRNRMDSPGSHRLCSICFVRVGNIKNGRKHHAEAHPGEPWILPPMARDVSPEIESASRKRPGKTS